MNKEVIERLAKRVQVERDQMGFTTTKYDELDAELEELRFLLQFKEALYE